MKNPFEKQILSRMAGEGYRPANKSDFAKMLGVAPKQRPLLRDALKNLEKFGKIVRGKKALYYLPGASQADTPDRRDRSRDSRGSREGTNHPGRIDFHPDPKRQSARFVPDDPSKIAELEGEQWPEVFISGRNAATAMNGDRVIVRVSKKDPSRPRRENSRGKRLKPEKLTGKDSLEGRVVEILERKNIEIVGTYHARGKSAALVPDNSRLPKKFLLSRVLKKAKSGDTVLAKFEKWDDPKLPPVAGMTEILGKTGDPGLDIVKIIHSHNLPLEFPQAVLDEAEAIEERISDQEITRREDWRDREVFTIDPEDAKDFDDAISVVENDDGSWELAVHIADVSHYVKPGTALDKEAKKRGNSCYLADRVVPMLPEKLSNGVCSLKPDVERLTHCSVIKFTANGTVKSARFCSAVIKSARRYTYEEAIVLLKMQHAEIAGLEYSERKLAEHIQRAWKLADMLRKLRFEAGGLDLDFVEVKVQVDRVTGKPTGVKRSEYDESHQLIEEFMLAANEAVAKETKNKQAPSAYRIHEDPDPEKLMDFAEQARAYGHKVHDVTIRKELQKVLKSVRGRPEEHVMKIALLKSLKRAAYSSDPIGHYGLSKVNYTHFTSPIRRYADLIVHRVLRKITAKTGGPPADQTLGQGALASVCKHISETERVAADAEKESQQLKMVEYLLMLAKEESDHSFDALINEVGPMGAFVELPDYNLKGLIRRQDFPEGGDYFIDTKQKAYVPRNKKLPTVKVGKTIPVRVLKVDPGRGFLDFEIVIPKQGA